LTENTDGSEQPRMTKTVEQIIQEEQEEKEKFEKLQGDLKEKESKLSSFEKKLDEIMKLQKSIAGNK
jgi:DNA-binding transcriptional regulator GbsR (MarR family)